MEVSIRCATSGEQCVVCVGEDESVGSLTAKAVCELGCTDETAEVVLQDDTDAILGSSDTRIADTPLQAQAELQLVILGANIKAPHCYPCCACEIAVSPSGTRLACGEELGIVSVWNTTSGTALWRSAKSGTLHAYDVSFSLDGRHLASTRTREVVLWDAATGTPLHILPHPRPVQAVRFAHNVLLTGTTKSLDFYADGEHFRSVVVSAGALHVAGGGEAVLCVSQSVAKVVDIASGVCVREVAEGLVGVSACGGLAALVTVEGVVLYSMPDVEQRGVVAVPPVEVECIAVSSKGLVACSCGSEVWLCATAGSCEWHVLESDPVDDVCTLHFSPCGKWLFIAASNTVIVVSCRDAQ